jgi:hypothetical protein
MRQCGGRTQQVQVLALWVHRHLRHERGLVLVHIFVDETVVDPFWSRRHGV